MSFQPIKKYSSALPRDKILSKEQFDALMQHSPRHIEAIRATGFSSGMRLGEVLSPTWDKVTMDQRLIRLESSDTKDREARVGPMGSELFKILDGIPRAIHDNHVFQFKGKPMSDIRTGLKKGYASAGIPYGRFVKDGFIFHDLRQSFNTYMRKAGVPESVIMEITGHSTREMFDRYNTVDHDDKANRDSSHGRPSPICNPTRSAKRLIGKCYPFCYPNRKKGLSTKA
jgi:integrase